MHTLKKGLFIVLEGIDGSGKTSLARNLYNSLENLQLNVLLTKEPGGSALGCHLRNLLQAGTIPIIAKTEYLLFAADRAQHVHDTLKPALEKNYIVICDRYCDSSTVYQGYGRGLDITILNKINTWVTNNLQPDITLFVQISSETAQKRLAQRSNASVFDKESQGFFKKLIDGYTKLYKENNNVVVLNGEESERIVAKNALEVIMNKIRKL